MKHLRLTLYLKFFVTVLVLPGAVIGSLIHLNQKGFFNLEDVQIKISDIPGGTLYLQSEIKIIKNQIESMRGTSLWTISLQNIEKGLKKIGWAKTYSLKRSWPNTLVVQLEPEQVKFVYVNKAGQFFPVLENGEMMGAVDPSLIPDVALLSGDLFRQNKELVRKAIDAIDQIPEKGTFSRKTISEVHYSPKDGFWMTMIQKGLEIKMGQDGFALKSSRVSKVMDYLDAKEIQARRIDADLSKKVFVKLKKDKPEADLPDFSEPKVESTTTHEPSSVQ